MGTVYALSGGLENQTPMEVASVENVIMRSLLQPLPLVNSVGADGNAACGDAVVTACPQPTVG